MLLFRIFILQEPERTTAGNRKMTPHATFSTRHGGVANSHCRITHAQTRRHLRANNARCPNAAGNSLSILEE